MKRETERVERESWQETTGDMPPDVFRAYGRQVVDWIAGYLENVEQYRVLSTVGPGDIRSLLPETFPRFPESIETILSDFDETILPGITHWNHPGFLAYFAVTGSAPGILAEMLAATLNVNAMLWRTSPSASELEATTLDWLRQMIGLPESFEGVIYDTASVSSMVAIAAAREAAGLDINAKGMAGRHDLPRLRLYCSEQAHSSIEKDALTLGIGREGVRKVSVDERYRMSVGDLECAVTEDIESGWRPFCTVATVGTTSTTSVDPVADIARVCRRHQMWLHVDAAYGGAAAILPEMRWVMDGVDLADSLVVNPHKWLFTPVDLSAFYSPRLDAVRNAFSLVPEYLRTAEDESVRNYMDYGPQLGRRFRALKLWFVLRAYGQVGLQNRIREHIRLGRELCEWIDQDENWERLAPAPFSAVCFRAKPAGHSESDLDALNQELIERVNATGQVFVSHTRLRDKLTIRVAIGNIRTEERHVQRLWELLREALRAELGGR